MAQDQANLVEWNTMTQHLGGRGVAKEVSAFSRRYDSGTPQSALHDA
jgi:hypothetical protein